MNKDSRNISSFDENHIKPILFEFLDLLDIDFYRNLEGYKAYFMEEFEACCKQVANIQKTMDFKVGNMVFTLLRKNTMDQIFEYPIYIYNKNWYLEKGYMVGSLKFDHIYKYYSGFFEAVVAENKKAFTKLPAPDIEFATMKYLDYFHNYIVALVRYSIFDAIKSDTYYAMKKEDVFQIHTGEYFEPCALLYKERAEKNYIKLRYGIKSRNDKNGCACEDFSGIDLTGIEGCGLNYRYSDFRKSTLIATNFAYSDLTESIFCDSEMTKCNLSLCILSGANFENCGLQHADFRYSLASIGNQFGGMRQKNIYTGLNFRNSCLIGADFSHAVLKGGDFRGADLSHAVFQGATLFRTRFSKEQADLAELSEEQRQQIIID